MAASANVAKDPALAALIFEDDEDFLQSVGLAEKQALTVIAPNAKALLAQGKSASSVSHISSASFHKEKTQIDASSSPPPPRSLGRGQRIRCWASVSTYFGNCSSIGPTYAMRPRRQWSFGMDLRAF
jgi:hypothetical protein